MEFDKDEYRRVFLPYCLQKQQDGRYAVLNRHYKPVGLTERDFVKYEDYPCLVRFQRLTAAKAQKLSYSESPELERIYLYNDGCVPTDSAAHWTAYSKRLQVLAKMTITA